jgi:O-antigen ligase
VQVGWSLTAGRSIGRVRTVGRGTIAAAAVLAALITLPWQLVVPVALAGTVAIRFSTTRADAPTTVGMRNGAIVWPSILASILFAIVAAATTIGPSIDRDGVRLIAIFAAIPLMLWVAADVAGRVDAPSAVWSACVTTATGSGVVALTQVVVQGDRRAAGWAANELVFGNLALLAAAVAVVLMPLATAATVGATTRWTTAAALLGGLAGILSGSRGGWLAIPLLLAGIAHARRDERNRNPRSRSTIAVVGSVAVAGVVLSGGEAVRRLLGAAREITEYASDGSGSAASNTSIGARIDAWRTALDAWLDRPVTGIGWGRLDERFVNDAELGERAERIAQFDHAHQQFLGALASSGIVGALAWLGVLAVPGVLFFRLARREGGAERRIGFAGLLVVGGYGVFSLTEAMFEHVGSALVYAALVGALGVAGATSQAADVAVRGRRAHAEA